MFLVRTFGYVGTRHYISGNTIVWCYTITFHTDTWKSLPSFQQYLVSQKGIVKKVYGNKKEKVISSRVDQAGYRTVRLSSAGITKTFRLHRLIAELFVPNTHNLPVVNHKNGDKLDNRPDNLEWVTHAENIKHAYDKGLIKQDKKVRQVLNICTGKTYSSIKDAAADLALPYSTCRNQLSGNIKTNSCLRYLKDAA